LPGQLDQEILDTQVTFVHPGVEHITVERGRPLQLPEHDAMRGQKPAGVVDVVEQFSQQLRISVDCAAEEFIDSFLAQCSPAS
jgi:hypothetical protein